MTVHHLIHRFALCLAERVTSVVLRGLGGAHFLPRSNEDFVWY